MIAIQEDDGPMPKKLSGVSNITEADKVELIHDSEQLLERVLTLDTESDQDLDDGDSIASAELERLNQIIDDELGLVLDEELYAMHKKADKAIKDCCVKVAIAMMSANAAMVIPGVGRVIGMMLGAAAAAGLVVKLQRDLVTELAEIFESPMSETQKDKILKLITGATKAATIGSKAAGWLGKNAAKNQIKAVAKTAAKANKSKFTKFVPLIGPLIGASVSMTTTYVIGKRSKVFFTKRLQRRRETGENSEEFDDSVIETWDETVQMLTGTDQKIISKYLKEAMSSSVQNMKSAVIGAKTYTVNKGKSTFSTVVSSVRWRNKARERIEAEKVSEDVTPPGNDEKAVVNEI